MIIILSVCRWAFETILGCDFPPVVACEAQGLYAVVYVGISSQCAQMQLIFNAVYTIAWLLKQPTSLREQLAT